MRRLAVLAAAASTLLACVEPFRGSRVEMTLVGVPPLQRGVTAEPADNPQGHYELWASVGRVDPATGTLTSDAVMRLMENGFTVQHVLGRLYKDPAAASQAEGLSFDPCFLDRTTGEKLYYKPSELEALRLEKGWSETSPEYLDRARIQTRALALASNAILAFTSHAARGELPNITASTDAERLAQCQAFFAGEDCADDACRADRERYFVGDSEQMSIPINGKFYGLLGEGAEVRDPMSGAPYGGIEVITEVNLVDLTGLFVTFEPDQLDAAGNLIVDANARGPAITWGTSRDNMRGVHRVEMRNEAKTVYGTATVFYQLGSDTVGF